MCMKTPESNDSATYLFYIPFGTRLPLCLKPLYDNGILAEVVPGVPSGTKPWPFGALYPVKELGPPGRAREPVAAPPRLLGS